MGHGLGPNQRFLKAMLAHVSPEWRSATWLTAALCLSNSPAYQSASTAEIAQAVETDPPGRDQIKPCQEPVRKALHSLATRNEVELSHSQQRGSPLQARLAPRREARALETFLRNPMERQEPYQPVRVALSVEEARLLAETAERIGRLPPDRTLLLALHLLAMIAGPDTPAQKTAILEDVVLPALPLKVSRIAFRSIRRPPGTARDPRDLRR